MERVTRLVCIFAAQKSHAHFYCAKISRLRGIRRFRQNKKPGQSPTKWVCPGKGGTALWVRSAPKGLNKRYNACTDAVTRLVCIFAAQKLMFGSVKPSPLTCHRQVRFNSSSHRHRIKNTGHQMVTCIFWSG